MDSKLARRFGLVGILALGLSLSHSTISDLGVVDLSVIQSGVALSKLSQFASENRAETMGKAVSTFQDSRNLFFEAVGDASRSPKQAISKLRKALEEDPSFESARERISELYLEQGTFDDAQREAARCLDLNSHNLSCHRVMIEALEHEGGLDLAEPAVRDCLAAKQDDFFCLEKAKDYYSSRGDSIEFEDLLRRSFMVGSRDPEDEELMKGIFWYQAGDTEKARKSYLTACNLGSQDACKALESISGRGE